MQRTTLRMMRCNVQRSTSDPRKSATCNVQTCNVQRTSLQRGTCNVQRLTPGRLLPTQFLIAGHISILLVFSCLRSAWKTMQHANRSPLHKQQIPVARSGDSFRENLLVPCSWHQHTNTVGPAKEKHVHAQQNLTSARPTIT